MFYYPTKVTPHCQYPTKAICEQFLKGLIILLSFSLTANHNERLSVKLLRVVQYHELLDWGEVRIKVSIPRVQR